MTDRGPYWKNRVAELKRAHKCERCGGQMHVAETRACCAECRQVQSVKEKAARRTKLPNEKCPTKRFVVL